MIDLTQFTCAVVSFGFALIVVKVIPYIKNKYDAEKLAQISMWVKFAVDAAEQMAESGQIEKDDKFKWVCEFITSKGYTLDFNEVKVLIESHVNELPKLLECVGTINPSEKSNNE